MWVTHLAGLLAYGKLTASEAVTEDDCEHAMGGIACASRQ